MSRVLAGPMAGMMLGDLGADVIKVERTGQGDETRAWGPPFDERNESAYFLSVNRNKLSLAADFADQRDRDCIRRLVSEADIVIDNFLPGMLTRHGLHVAELLDANPKLVWCTITGFGAGSRRLGYDFVVQAEAGWMAITGDPAGDPMKSGVALADIIAGKDAVIAILAALVRRDASPASARRLVVSLAHSARAALVNVAQNALVSGEHPARWGNAHPNLVPYQLFQAQDRAIVIAVGSDAQWQALTEVLDLKRLGADPDLATNAGRIARRSEVVAAISAAVASRSASEWQQKLDAARVPCGIVKGVLDAIEDAAHASPLMGMPSSIGGRVRFPPPRLDEHGSLIRGAGWSVFGRYP